MTPEALKWDGESLFLLDQRLLPFEVKYVKCETAESVALAIENMTVRGAPAIGAAAAFGLALTRGSDFDVACRRMSATRPTAVNLFWATERMKAAYKASAASDKEGRFDALVREALKIREEDVLINKKIGRFGEALLPQECAVITHCNAGAIATAGYGTALGARAAKR